LGFKDLFRKKSADSSSVSAPEISDLPPIPETPPSLDLDNKIQSNDQNLKVDEQNTSLNNTSDDVSQSDLSLGDIHLDNSLNPSLNSKEKDLVDTTQNSLELSSELNETNLSSDLPIVDSDQEEKLVSSSDVFSDVSSSDSSDTSLIDSSSDVSSSNDDSLSNSSSDIEQNSDESSLPVFNNLSNPSSSDFDIASLSVSELFIKKDEYVHLLSTLQDTKKELDVLINKSKLTKMDDKFKSFLLKSFTLNKNLNKQFIFIEEKLIE